MLLCRHKSAHYLWKADYYSDQEYMTDKMPLNAQYWWKSCAVYS